MPNIVLFRFLPPVIAYNIALASTVLLLGVGMYCWCRILKFSAQAAWFVAISIMFSGLTMAQLPHITLLQGMSLLPVIAALSTLVVTRGPYPWAGFLSFALSQQIAAGFPQSTFLTLVISAVFVGYFSLPHKKWQPCAFWFVGVLLGIGGGMAQILPSWEFLQSSTDPGGFTPTTATSYSMPIQHLISFIFPFALGNPKLGTYPPFYAFDGSIFWENTAYIGILPILLLITAFFLLRKQQFFIFLFVLSGLALMLAGGKYAPTYVLFSAWPLTLFRVPSRFLWLGIIGIALIGGMVTDHLRHLARSKWVHALISLLILLHGTQLLNTWWSYHLMEPSQFWLRRPAIANKLDSQRIITIGHGALYNRAVTGSGWKSAEPYRFLREGVPPDSNMIWHVSQHNVYAGRYLKRPAITDSLLSESIKTDEHMATISAMKFVDFFSIRHILSFLPLDAPGLTRETQIRNGADTLTLYTNPGALPRAYLVYEASQAATLTEAVAILTGSGFTAGNSVLLEQHEIKKNPALRDFLMTLPQSRVPEPKKSVTWEHNAHETLTLSVYSSSAALLVLTDTYYPGWRATVDGVSTPIFAANLSQRAVMVPEGNHTVTFFYRPDSLLQGLTVSLVSMLLTVLLMIALKLYGGAHIQKKVPEPVSRHPRNRGK